ncbi:MAG TPA: KH domain-containing protein [Bacillota bacterium]|nr:KH domain-containing protein [Candidatus Fermentithermobacillaceae bacterium]HOB30066.1 KH domain-containing protein [Bacillota bacterium]HOK63956.1 KH domain-containing protein [Bacillota bacterium]HOL11311.1 KH domain-containing protein [Bacillota bacterium]HOQ02440.1 KH domain-containing protein [Bacillota bacterium]
MKDLVTYIAKSIVDHPDQVEVNEVEGERTVVYELRVAPEDMGKVIGKKGRVIHSVRAVVQAAAAKEGKRATVEILE